MRLDIRALVAESTGGIRADIRALYKLINDSQSATQGLLMILIGVELARWLLPALWVIVRPFLQ